MSVIFILMNTGKARCVRTRQAWCTPFKAERRGNQGTYKTCALLQPVHQLLQSPNHLSQFAQTRSVSFVMGEEGVLKSVLASACLSRICSARPSLAWKAVHHRVNIRSDHSDGVTLPMWQCISHVPGLSDLNAITTKPFTGKSTTSRRGGLDSVKLSLSGEYVWLDC